MFCGQTFFRSVFSVISLFLCVYFASAQTDSASWTYAQCLDYAQAHNISIQKVMLGERTAAIDLAESKAAWYPTLDFATSHSYANYPFGAGSKNTYNSNYGVNAAWNVYDGGVRTGNIKKDKLQQEISRINTGDALRSLETDLLQVYINILYAREAIVICREAAKLSEAQADRARQLMEAGRLSRVDYARLNSQYEQDKYSLVSAQSTFDTRRMELKQLLQLGLDTVVNPSNVDWSAAQVLAPLPDIDESYKLALATDLNIRGLELQKSVALADVDIAKAGRMPKISLSAGVGTGWMTPGIAFGTGLKNNFGENIGLSLSVPIFDNDKTKSAVARARVAEEESQLDIDQRRRDLSQLVENWYIDTRSAQARYRAAESQLESARLTDELTNEQFNLGYVNTVELMDAHNSYTESRHALLQAKYMAMLGRKMIEFYRNGKVTL